MTIETITPCLWFDKEAEEAANYYVSIFKKSKITYISHYGKEGFEIHQMPEGTVLAIGFELNGQSFTAINAGPRFKFTEAISFQIGCETQKEIDYYWEKLTANGGEESYCGWLKDKYGLSWQVNATSEMMEKIMNDPKRSGKAMTALMQMRKLDLATLQNA